MTFSVDDNVGVNPFVVTAYVADSVKREEVLWVET
jgi:hypothetical protein